MNQKQQKRVYNAVIILLIVAGVCYVCSRFVHFGSVEYTDDAQVRMQLTPVNSRVQGFVERICFTDYQFVHKGDTLAIIEDSEYRLHLAQSEAQYALATAGRDVASTSVNTAQNNIGVSRAAVEAAKARFELAEKELARYQSLLAEKAVTPQQFERVEAEYRAAKAGYEQMSRMTATQTLLHSEQQGRLTQNDASIRLAEAMVNLARLNLSYTVIVAPCDGYTGRKDLVEGQLVQPGQTVVNIVSADEVWVVANYRETQMQNIVEGAEVEIEVDAVKGVLYKGRVESISGATEAAYLRLPSSNAAGNFVKVEQRLPVRIAFTAENSAEAMARLRTGLNVECVVKY